MQLGVRVDGEQMRELMLAAIRAHLVFGLDESDPEGEQAYDRVWHAFEDALAGADRQELHAVIADLMDVALDLVASWAQHTPDFNTPPKNLWTGRARGCSLAYDSQRWHRVGDAAHSTALASDL